MTIHGRRKIAIIMLLAVLCMNLMPGFSTGQGEVIISPMVTTASAAEVTLAPGAFGMMVNSKLMETGQLIELTKSDLEVSIAHSSGFFPSDASVKWLSYDSNVISVTYISKYQAVINAVGPGYSQLAAIVTYNGMDYHVFCQVYVPLEIDIDNNVTEDDFGMVQNLTWGAGQLNVGFQLKNDGTGGNYNHYLVKLKNVKYADGVTNHTQATTGQAITVTPPAITWTSSDKTVVDVDSNGILTAVGAGYATVTVETNTVYNGVKKSKTVPVFVSPLGKVSTSTTPKTDEFEFTASTNSFTIDTNAAKSTNLVWTIHKGDNMNGEDITDDKKLIEMTLSDYSGAATFSNVKAGTYYITARPFKSFDEKHADIKKLKFKVIVPLFFMHNSITMNVNDFYDILANSNLPDNTWYRFTSQHPNVASVISDDGVITAHANGDTVVNMKALVDTATDGAINVRVVDGIGLNMTNATIYTGSKLQLILTTSNDAAPIEWSSSKPTVASVSKNGLVTGLSVGDTVITVKQKINGVTKVLTCQIKVKQSVTSVTLIPSDEPLAVGDFLTINATVEPKLNSVSLHWVSSNSKVVEISDSGALSATVLGVGGGVAVISAINQDNIVVGSCLIRVFQPIAKITLSETNVTVPLSDRWFQLYASIEPFAAKEQELVWKSTDTSILTVDSNGKVTLVKSGKASVIVSSKINASISAICNITVTKAVTGITLDYKTKDMYVGETFRLTYVVKPADSSNANVTWTSSNPSVASVDKTGMVAAKSVGSTTIILKTADGGFIATCIIKVSRVATSVKLDVTQLTMNVGDYYNLETTLTPADATETGLVWETSDKKVATVSKTGKVIAKAAGTTIIMVKTKNGSIATCKVTVFQPVTGIEISSEEENLTVGDEIELTATVLPENASDQGVTWKSSAPRVAKVNAKGEVTAVGGGVAMISVTSDDGDYKAYCMVTVEEYITEITLNKTSYRLGLGKTYRLVAKINGENATNKQLSWSSSNKSIVTVDKNGTIKGIKLGVATITVRATDGSGAEATCRVRVTREVTSISLSTNYITLVQGKSYNLKANIYPSNATFKTANYVSNKTNVAMVNQSGTITALTPGTAIITVKAKDSSGVKAICYVNVIAPIASTGISISESEVVMSPGESKTVAISIIPNNSTDTLTWTSDNNAVVQVNKSTGKMTAKELGTANITVMTESGRKGSIKVYVVGLSKTKVTLEQYTNTIINLEVDGAGSSNLKVRWDVENQAIATVRNGKVTTKAVGTTYVYAVVNGRRLACKITVTKIK